MSNQFDVLFVMPAIPAIITGKNDVAIRGGNVLSIIFGHGNTPEMRGAALLAAVAESAFDAGGKAFTRLEAKGAKKALTLALQAGTLPACRGGKNPVPLLAADVQAFIDAMRTSMGEVKEKATAAPKLPEVAAFIAKHGDVAAKDFAAALMSALGGAAQFPSIEGITVTEEASVTEPALPVRKARIKRA